MTSNDVFADRKRAQEEEYFRKQEQQYIEQMRHRMALEAERRELAEAFGVGNEEVLQELQELGFTREMAPLLYLVPLMQVAWAEGQVSAGEREVIFAAARLRGIAAGSSTDKVLSDWLDQRPVEIFFEKTLRALSALLRALPAAERELQKRDLISACTQVAEASGGLSSLLGFRSKINSEERELLAHITAELERDNPAAEQAMAGE